MTANRPEQPLKTQQLRKRYRQLRRKQLAGALLIAGLAIALLVLLGIGIFALRSCARQSDSALRARLAEERGEDSLPQLACQRVFTPAPWLTAVSDTALFCASDSTRREAGYPNYPIDTVAAFPVEGDAEPLWESSTGTESMRLAATAQSLVLISHTQGYPAQVALRGLDRTDGHEVWSQVIADAESPSFAVSGKVVVVGYWLADGYRVVGYNAATGVKAWGYKLGTIGEIDLSAGAPRLRLLSSDKLICYSLGSGIGFIDSGSGRLLRRETMPAEIGQLTIDWHSGMCLLASEADGAGQCALYRMPVNAGVPVQLYQFVLEQGMPQLVQYAGNSLLAYCGRETAEADSGCQFVCFKQGATTPEGRTTLAPGIPVAAAAFPGGADGALVSVSSELDDAGMPAGHGYLARVSSESGLATFRGRLARPVVALLPFRQDIVMLGPGNSLRVFAAPLNRHLLLAELTGPECNWSYSSSQATLLVTSHPRSSSSGQPAERMQAVVLK